MFVTKPSGIQHFCFSIIILALIQSIPSTAETMYVKRSDTKVMEQESTRSKVVGMLSSGTPVNVLIKKKRYYKIEFSKGKQGWIFKFKLAARVLEKKSEIDGFAGLLGGRQIVAVRKSNSGSSIQGLSPASKAYAKNKGISEESLHAVEEMENHIVSPEVLDEFQKAGKLGRYGP